MFFCFYYTFYCEKFLIFFTDKNKAGKLKPQAFPENVSIKTYLRC